jgi:hypothetical protein
MRPMASRGGVRFEQLEDRYVLAAMLIIATIVATAVGGDDRTGQLFLAVMESVTLLVVFHASRVSLRTMRITAIIVVALLVGTMVTILAGDQIIGPRSVGAALALAGPVVIVRRIRHHSRIDLETVAASVCIYLLAGVFFAYVFHVIDAADGPFFGQTGRPSSVDFLYFSFTTLTTLGYGDLTPVHSLGKMLAVSEALLGQIYLVSVVALLVGNIGRVRRGIEADEDLDAESDVEP